jgi:hypothetical protein
MQYASTSQHFTTCDDYIIPNSAQHSTLRGSAILTIQCTQQSLSGRHTL